MTILLELNIGTVGHPICIISVEFEDAPAVHQSSIRNLITYDSVEDLTYIWRTRA